MRKYEVTVYSVSLLAFLVCLGGGFADDPPVDAFVKWVQGNAVSLESVKPGHSFDDLRPVKKIIGDARIVCLGESRHDAREHFLFKHRMIEFLVEEMGFTLFAMEESLPCAMKINDYIHGGEGDPEALLNSMGAWYIWDTEEVLSLIKWMRKYNDDPAHEKKIHFHGVDIADPLQGVMDVLAYLRKVDPEYSETLREESIGLDLFSANIWSESMANYGRLSSDDLDALKKRFAVLLSRFESKRSEYISRSSAVEYEWVFREALTAKRANDLFTTMMRSTFQEAGDVRERAMADNIRWILKQHGQGERIIVWAHNFHVTRSSLDLNIPGRPATKDMVSMTEYLSKEMGDKMVAVGCSFNRGDFPEGPLALAGKDTVDWALARAGNPLFVVDLRAAPEEGPVHEWINRKQKMRGQGGFAVLTPLKTYDVIFFIEKITRTTPNPLALKRFGKR